MTLGPEGRYQRNRVRLTATGSETYTHTMTPVEVIEDHLHYSDYCSNAPPADRIVEWLTKAGYVIVHPDDIKKVVLDDMRGPEMTPADVDYVIGYHHCWANVFGTEYNIDPD